MDSSRAEIRGWGGHRSRVPTVAAVYDRPPPISARLRGDGGHGVKVDFTTAADIRDDVLARLDAAFEDLQRQRIRKQLLNRALQRPRAKRRIVALAEERFPRSRRKLQRDLAVHQVPPQRFELNIDNAFDLFLAEALEDDDVVDAVQELRFEMRAQRFANVVAGHAHADV